MEETRFTPKPCYYVRLDKYIHKYNVVFGIVDGDEFYYLFSELVYPFKRKINGIPESEFVNYTDYKKLPKNYTFELNLVHIEEEPVVPEIDRFDVRRYEDLVEAYNEGYLVPVSDSPAHLYNYESEVTRDGRYRIVQKLSNVFAPYRTALTSLGNIFYDYEEANQLAESLNKEIIRRAQLSDREFAIEEMSNVLNRWQSLYKIPDDTVSKVKDYLLSLKDFENTEFRLFMENVEFKNFKNKRWVAVDYENL